ncbi:hypothetical protein SLS62_009103 [Diatrype stigma]|uniref:Inositol polyphosphate-related phosphatase domain-containing protein n=1 Tax=Diatrype stigma TaxID=117547 RepID=A0AAN9UFY1_9PEZI
MEPNEQEGPDGSSLKSVSSLRSRFENMQGSKPKDAPTTPISPMTPMPPVTPMAPQPPAPVPPAPAPPPPRTASRSPSPKPPPIPDTRPNRNSVANISQQNGPAKPRESLDVSRPQIPALMSTPAFANGSVAPNRSSRIMNPPSLSPNPTRPPSVLVDPPHSPPRENNIATPFGDPGSRLNPDPHKGPTTPGVPPNRSFKIPSRPNTPGSNTTGFEPRPSPKLNASQPPSPPPPRRSGEFRREQAKPPPVNRAEKPSVRMSNLMENVPKLEASPRVADHRSPFSSPPESEDEAPPVLPARPARPPQQQKGQFGLLTRVWSVLDGDQLTSFSHGEGIKATAVKFKSTMDIRYESTRIWIGTNTGELMEADAATQSLVTVKPNAHGRFEVIRIFRHFNEMWTLDESGTLHVWGPDSEGLPNLNNNPHQTFRLPRGHTFSMIVGEELWHATGKEIRIFHPTVDGRTQVQVLVRPLISEGAGEVTSGALLKTQPGKVFFGHADGKVSIYSQKDFTCLSVLTVSNYKINSLAGVGRYIWAGYNSGKICVYDVEQSPWVVKKDFQAHKDPVIKIIADPSSFYYIERLQVISLGADNVLRSWDGLLQDDFLETELKAIDTRYCTFQDIKVLAMTWNAGASTPSSLRYSASDSGFIQNLIQSNGTPDILIFGFQELVDLEDKTATAKRLFKSKKKDPVTDQERMSHQYRDWRDFLVRSLDDYMPADTLYHLLHTATLVGLFTCIFVKSSIHGRIRNLSSSHIKRGMGGLHGNKGAIVVRFLIDDTSLCFVNCHLAAGQSQANARHNDIKEIMDAAIFQPELDPAVRMDSYTGGGDGSMILDHELCLLNGDLNYRIDTMSRDTVVMAVKSGNLTKLLERDQLLVARRRNPAFKLRAFDELPITFAPTYKYDVGTDNYDSSEKKRSPAWCDRLLHRGNGRIHQVDYRRHEVRVSDHRPVTGRFKYTIKAISPRERILAWADCQQRFEAFRQKEGQEEKLNYLMNLIGYDLATSQQLIQDKESKKLQRSLSRHAE